MTPRDLWRATKQWGPFAARTAFYGSLSITAGPLTNRRASLWAMKTWCKKSTRALNIEVDVQGLENVPASGPFVYASNHQSIVDIIVLGSVLRGDYKWAAKRSLWKIPFLGWHLALSGHVPVDRKGGPRAAADVIQRFEAVLRSGKPLLVFPEGTRTPDGSLRQFKSGGFYAAVRAGVPVVPVALNGTFDLMRRGAQDTGEDNLRRVTVRVGAPIQLAASAPQKEAERVADLRVRTYNAVSDMFLAMGGRPSVDDEVAPPSEPASRDDEVTTAHAFASASRGSSADQQHASR